MEQNSDPTRVFFLIFLEIVDINKFTPKERDQFI